MAKLRKSDQSAPAEVGPTGTPDSQDAENPRAQSGRFLTTAQGVRLPDTDHSLKAGERGPTLLEDFHFREKITHFDHERIPERVVHARGSGAHGIFTSYGSAASVTSVAGSSHLARPKRDWKVTISSRPSASDSSRAVLRQWQ